MATNFDSNRKMICHRYIWSDLKLAYLICQSMIYYIKLVFSGLQCSTCCQKSRYDLT